MKRINKFLMTSVLLGTMMSMAMGQNRVTVSQTKYVHKGDSVYVELVIGLNNSEVSKNRYILLTPAIKDGDESLELPAVMINGKQRHKAYRRLLALGREPDGTKYVLNAGEKNARPYLYTATAPYEPWMSEAEFAIREDQCDCNGPLVKMSFDLIVGRMQNVDDNMPLNLTASFKEPAPEPVKTRSETGKAYLDFVVGKYDLMPDFRNNAAELKKIGDMIMMAKNDPAITITGIVINGYASPDGVYTSNMMLSGNRTVALKDYVRTVYVFDDNMFRVIGHGEDWKTLETLIASSDVAYKEDALEIIRSTESFDVRKKDLMALQGGAVYRDMLDNFFPQLRRSDYELQYTVIPFTVEEGKTKLETNPKLLSLNEMFLIAQTYPAGSPEFRKIFDIAALTYPDSEIANLNAAANALDAYDVEIAKKYLSMLETHDAAYHNNMGVLAAMQGEHAEAAEYFRKAVAGGNSEAAENLAEIEKVKRQYANK